MLQPDKLKKLNENAYKMSQAGKSQEDIIAMKDAFIKQFGTEDIEKKKDTSTSTIPAPSSESVQKVGSSATQKPSGFPKIDTNSIAPNVEGMKYVQEKKDKRQDFLNNVDLNDNDKTEIEQKVNNKLEGKGFFNTATDYLSRTGSAIKGLVTAPTIGLGVDLASTALGTKTDLAENDKKQAVSELKKEGIPITPKAVEERTKQIIRSTLEDNKISEKYNTYFEDKTDKEREDLAKTTMDAEFQADVKLNASNIKKNLEYEKINHIDDQLKDLKLQHDKGIDVSEQANELLSQRNESVANYNKHLNDFTNNTKNLMSVRKELDLVSRDYHSIETLPENIGAGFERILGGTLSYGGQIMKGLEDYSKLARHINPEYSTVITKTADLVHSVTGYRMSEIAKKTGASMQEQSQRELNKLQKPMTLDDINNAYDLGAFVGQETVTQAPILATAMSGNLGMAVLGASTAGNKIQDMETEEKLDPSVKYSDAEKLLASTGFGLSEVLLGELPSVRILKRSIAAATASDIEKSLFKKGMKMSTTLLKSPIEEGVTEGLTEFSNNAVDKYYLGKKNTNLYDNVTYASFTGGFLGGVMETAPHLIGSAIKPFIKDSETKVIDSNLIKVFNYQTALNKDGVTPENKALLQSKIDGLISENNKIIKSQIKVAENTSETKFNAINEIMTSKGDLLSKAESIKSDDNIPTEVKKTMLQDLQTQYKQLNMRHSGIVDGSITEVDLLPIKEQDAIKKQALKELTEEQNPDGTKNITIDNAQITERANKIHTENLKSIEDAKKANEPEAKPQAEVQKPSEAEKVDGNYIFEGKEYVVKDGSISDTDGNLFPRSFDGNNKYDNVVSKGKKVEPQEVSPVEDVVSKNVGSTYIDNKGDEKIITQVNKDGSFLVKNNNNKTQNPTLGNEKDLFKNKEDAVAKRVSIEENKDVEVESRKAFDIFNNGEKVGRLGLEDNGNTYQVSSIKIDTPNKGIGTESYKQLINSLDKPLVSDIIRSDSAESVWKKLEKEGFAKFNPNTNQYTSISTNEATPPTNTPADGNLPIGADNVGEVRATKQEAPAKESVPSTVDVGKDKGDVEVGDLDHAKSQIEKGVLNWDSNILTPRVDLGMSWADIRKGEADIKRGKENSVPAKRLIEALAKAKKEGGYNYKQGTGGENQRAKLFVSLEDIERSTSESGLTEKEQEYINANEEKLAKEYEDYFNGLDLQTQNDIYENKEGISGLDKKDATRGQSKDDVSNQENAKEPKSTTKEKVAERIKLSDAKIDDLANALKDLLPKAPDTSGLKKQGISQDDLIDFIAKNAKILASATITIDEAIRQVIDHLKSKGFDIDVEVDTVKEKLEPKKTFKIEGVEYFHHASDSKRSGRLKTSNAPQFGTGVYFSTNKNLVEDIYGGENTTTVRLGIKNPVYNGSKEWNEVQSLAIENADKEYGERKGLTLDEDETYFRYDKENLSELDEIPSKFISNAAKELGYDAIIDKGGSYENEIVVLDESKIIYPEDEVKLEPKKEKTTEAKPEGIDSRREKSSAETAKDLGISESDYLDVKDMVTNTPKSGVFNEYLSADTINDVFGEEPKNDQSYEKIVLLSLIEHGNQILEKTKELFGDEFIPKTLEFLKNTKLENFEKAIVYASLENLMDTMVKENPTDDKLKRLQMLVYADSQSNLRNSSKAMNAGRLRRLHNSIKNGIDVAKITNRLYTDKQKQAKTVLENALPTGDNLNKEDEVSDKEFTKEEFETKLEEEIAKAKKDWEETNLGFEIRETKIKIKKEEALAQIQKIKDNWKKASRDGTLAMSLPYAKQLIAVTPDIIKLANIYRQIGGMQTIDIIEAIKADVSDVFGSIKDKDIKAILKKEFGKKSRKISETAKRNAYIKLLNKSIESLDEQIEAKKRKVVEKVDKYKNDLEIKELRDVRDEKKELLAEIDPNYAKEKRLKTDLKLAQKSLDEYERKLEDSDFRDKEKSDKNIDQKLKSLRLERDLKRKEYLKAKKQFKDSLKEPAIQKTKEEIENEKYISDIKRKEAILEKQIKELLDNEPQKSNDGKYSVWNDKISKLQIEKKSLLDAKNKAIKEQKELSKTKKTDEEIDNENALKELNSNIKRTKKSIEELEYPTVKDNNGKSSVISSELSALKSKLSLLQQKAKDIESNKKALEAQKAKASKISNIVKQALIDAGFSREITITKGTVDADGKKQVTKEKRTVLDWNKLTARVNNVNLLKENVEAVLKAQGYSDAKIAEISKQLEEEYARLSQNITDKAIAELVRRNLIKASPTQKSDGQKLAELNNKGLFGEDVKKYENLMNRILGFSSIDEKSYNEIKQKINALSALYEETADGKPLTPLSISSQESFLNKEISDLLYIAAFKKGNFLFKTGFVGMEASILGLKTLLGGIKTLAENVISGRISRFNNDNIISRESTPELNKQIKKNSKALKANIISEGGLDYGHISTSLVSHSLVEDLISKNLSSRLAHQIMSVVTTRRWLNAEDSFNKYKLTEPIFVKNAIKILKAKGMSGENALKFVSEALTGDNFDKALKTAKEVIDRVNSGVDGKQLKDDPTSIHRFAMDIVRQNLMNNNIMTMDEVSKSFEASYKSAGSDIGHEANNPVSKQVAKTQQDISASLDEAIRNEEWGKAVWRMAFLTIFKTIISPFAGGGMNWTVIGAEFGTPVVGWVSTVDNHMNKKELDLESEEGKKNIVNSLYYSHKSKASLVRNMIGLGIATSAYLALYGLSDDDEETNAKRLKKWMNQKENKWTKPYFNKLAPTPLVIMMAYENKKAGAAVAKTLGINGDMYDNTAKLFKAFDSRKKGATSGAVGKLVGQPFNSPISYKYIFDATNIWRTVNGLPELKTDYQMKGFLNGFFQGGLVEAVGLRPGESKSDKPKHKTSKHKKSYNTKF